MGKVKVISNSGGGVVQEIGVSDGATAEQVVEIVGVEGDSVSLRINGVSANLRTPVSDGDVVTVTPAKVSAGCA